MELSLPPKLELLPLLVPNGRVFPLVGKPRKGGTGLPKTGIGAPPNGPPGGGGGGDMLKPPGLPNGGVGDFKEALDPVSGDKFEPIVFNPVLRVPSTPPVVFFGAS